MSDIDFDALANAGNRRFLAELRALDLLDNLSDDTVIKLCATLLSNFKRPISKSAGNAILTIVAKFLMEGKITAVFIAEQMWKLLPYEKEDFADGVFDIMMILVVQKPDFAVLEFTDLFEKQIPLNPLKAITILARYAQKFNEVTEPFSLLDLLIIKFDIFKQRETVIQCLALCTYLCRQFDEFRAERAEHCWIKICKLTREEEDIEVLKSCYGALFGISSVANCRTGLSIRAATEHLAIPELTEAVLPFLIVCSDVLEGEDLIETLLEMAERDDRATLLLMRMCEQEKNAKMVASMDSWLDRPLPSYLDTLKLIYTVLGRLPTKEKTALVTKDEFVTTIKLGAQNGGLSNLSMIYGIIQRMVLTKKRVARFAREEVFSAFCLSSHDANSVASDRPMYRMFKLVARVAEVPELATVTVLAAKDLALGGELTGDAVQFLAEASKYASCLERMEEMGVAKLCEPLQRDRKLAPFVQTLLANLTDDE